ncbi:MAG: hypothetical protein ACK6BM_10355 [Cyanobacteriota bacterium]|jgi:hypothetical protein
MAYGTTKPRLSSSPSIVWVVAQRMMKSIFSPPMLGSIFVPYFFIFLGLSTGDVTYSDLALISARLAPCWASALFVGSFLYWLIRLPDSQKATPVPKLTRNELDYLKGGIEEVFKERLSEMSVYVDQMGMLYRTHGGDLKGSAQEALDPQSMLLAKQIKNSLQEKRLVLSQLGEILRSCCFILAILNFLNLGLIIIMGMLLVMASGLGLPPATFKNFQMHLTNYALTSLLLWIWSIWVCGIACPGNDRTRRGDAVLDCYTKYGSSMMS